jgi:hypothetical protein
VEVEPDEFKRLLFGLSSYPSTFESATKLHRQADAQNGQHKPGDSDLDVAALPLQAAMVS